jgi:hypothetical protein
MSCVKLRLGMFVIWKCRLAHMPQNQTITAPSVWWADCEPIKSKGFTVFMDAQ